MLALCFFLAVICVYVLTACTNPDQTHEGMLHKSVQGKVIAYQQNEQGLLISVETYSNVSPILVLISENTMWGSDELRERILEKELNIYVYIESEYALNDFDGIYPAVSVYDKME